MVSWQQIDHKRKPFIRMGERLFGDTYRDIRRSLLDEIRKAQQPQEIERVVEDFIFDVEMIGAFEKFYSRTALDFAKDFLKRYKSGKGPVEIKDEDLWLKKVLEYVRVHSEAKISKITRTHYNDIVRVATNAVQLGIDEGWGMDKIARVISKEQGLIDGWKALRIARTETVAASNYGGLLGAEDLPGSKVKVWISSFTTTSRDDHMAMEGVEVGINEPFIVAGEELMYPGDPSGSAGNIINCRCASEVIIKDDIF